MTHSSQIPPETPSAPTPTDELKNLPRFLHPAFKVILGTTAALAIGVPCLSGIQTAIPIVKRLWIRRDAVGVAVVIPTALHPSQLFPVNPQQFSLWLLTIQGDENAIG